MSDYQLDTSGRVALMPAASAVVTMRGLPNLQLGATPTLAVQKPALAPGNADITYWGESNDYPQKIIELANKSTIIPQALTDKAALWVAGGIMATPDRNSNVEVDDQEIYDFLNMETTQLYMLECAHDLSWWWNGFPEFILSENRLKILQLHNNETAHCRWGRMDEKTGALNWVYHNANWPDANVSDKETTRIPALNPYRFDRVDWVRNGKDFKYIYPLSFPSPGRATYQLAAWDAARSSGWLDYLAAIPQFKKYGLINSMSLRYHIEVSEDYWPKVYEERWEKADNAGKMAIRDEFLDGMVKSLTNAENAGKAILTDKWKDHNGEDQGITINVLDDKTKDGKYNEDYSDGQANLLYALGTDPSLFGFQSKDIQRSGGSDKRQAFDIFIAKSTPYRARILSPLRFIAEYNGWTKRYPRLSFKFRDTLLTTLDTGAPTKPNNTPSQ